MKKIKKKNPSRKMIENFIEEYYPDEVNNILLADGFDEAFLGVGCAYTGKNVAIYDRSKCIRILERDMSNTEAEEYFGFNVECAYVGDYTPIFMHKVG
jgi:hypothetical protein